MPRGKRIDYPGAWHHVMNRGIARRTVFEDRACVRYFLAKLARSVRAGDLEVHAFAVLATHYHLLVRSPKGRLSNVMQRVQNLFVRWFNRRARRDGPLFRGRFLSLPVESLEYRRVLVRYIDQNPVVAGMVEAPELYPYGSAIHHIRGYGPRWLAREWIQADAMARTGAPEFSAADYREAFGPVLSDSERALVELRIEHSALEPDPLDDLVGAAPERVASWMRRKAALADGTRPGFPCVTAGMVRVACDQGARDRPDWTFPRGNRRVDAWPVLRVALLRDLGGLGWAEIGGVTSSSGATAKRRYACHRIWIEAEPTYRKQLALVALECLQG